MSLQYEDTVIAEAEDEVDYDEELLEVFELAGEGGGGPDNAQNYNEYGGERSYEASEVPFISHIPVYHRLQSRVSSQFSLLMSEHDQFQDIVDSLPEDVVNELTDFWSIMERNYAYTTFMALEGISKGHDQLLAYPDTFSHELGTILEAPDERIQYADNFKYNFNRLRHSRRVEPQIKQILRQRVNELTIKLDGVVEEKYSKSKRDAFKLLSKGFLRTESEKMAALFGSLLQAQTDRFVDTIRFINGHYFKLIMEDLRAPIELAWRSLADICLLSKSLLCKYRHLRKFSKLHPNALPYKGGFKYGSFGGSPWANLPLLKQHEMMGEAWDDVAKSLSYDSTCSVETCDICDDGVCIGTPPLDEIKLSQILSSHEDSNGENDEDMEGESGESEGDEELGLDDDDEEEEGEGEGEAEGSASEDLLRPENSSEGGSGGQPRMSRRGTVTEGSRMGRRATITTTDGLPRMGRRATIIREEEETEEETTDDQVKAVSPTNQTTSSGGGKSKVTGSGGDKKGKKKKEKLPPAPPPPPDAPPPSRKERRNSRRLSTLPGTQKSEKSKDGSKGSSKRKQSSVPDEFMDEEDEDDEEMEGEGEMEDEDEGVNISEDIFKYYGEYMGEGYWEDSMYDRRGSFDSRRRSRFSAGSKKGASVDFNEAQEYIRDSAYWDSDSSKMEGTTTDKTDGSKEPCTVVKDPYDDEEYYDNEDVYYLRDDFYEKPIDATATSSKSKQEKRKREEICTPEPENLHFSIFGKDDDFRLEDSLINKLIKKWGQPEPDEEEEEEEEDQEKEEKEEEQEEEEMIMESPNEEDSKKSPPEEVEEQEQEKALSQENKSQLNDATVSEKPTAPINNNNVTFTPSVPPMSEGATDKKYSYVSSYSDGKWKNESVIEPNAEETTDENNNILAPAKLPAGEKRPLIESLSTLQDEIWNEFEYAFRDVQFKVEKMVGIVQEIITQGYPADAPSEESLEEESSSEEEEEQQEEQEPLDPCKKKRQKKKRCKCSHKNKLPQADGDAAAKSANEDSGGSKPGSKPSSKSPAGTDKAGDDNNDDPAAGGGGGGTGEEENSPEEEEAEDPEADPEEVITTVTTHLEFPEEQELEEQGSSGHFDMTKDPLYYKGEYLGEGFWEVEHSDQEETKEEDENVEKEERDENDEELERINYNAIIRTKLQNWETTLQLEVERLRRHLMVIGIKAHEELNHFREIPFKVWERSKQQASYIYMDDLNRDVEVGDVFRCAIDSASQLPGNFYIDTRDVKLLLNGTEPPIPLDYPESLRIVPSLMEDEDSSLEGISAEEE